MRTGSRAPWAVFSRKSTSSTLCLRLLKSAISFGLPLPDSVLIPSYRRSGLQFVNATKSLSIFSNYPPVVDLRDAFGDLDRADIQNRWASKFAHMIMGTVTHSLLFVGALFLLSAAITWLMIRVPIMDRPNQRSSHLQPLPRSGGVAIVVTTYVGLCVVWALSGHIDSVGPQLFGLGVGAAIIAGAGFLDDLRILESFKSKLMLQVLGCIAVMFSGVLVDRVPLPFIGTVEVGWWGYPITLLWFLGLTNIVNFMDGLNGLAAGTAAAVAAIFGTLAMELNSAFAPAMSFIFLAACSGFFIFNFPHAKIFMGDVGSQFLGFVLAVLAVLAASSDKTSISLFVMPLLFFHFIFDAIFTFFRRLIARENVTEAHRSHLYQLLNQIGCSHAQVSILHFVIAIAQGVGAMVLVYQPAPDQALVFLPFLAFQIVYATVIMKLARRRNII